MRSVRLLLLAALLAGCTRVVKCECVRPACELIPRILEPMPLAYPPGTLIYTPNTFDTITTTEVFHQ